MGPIVGRPASPGTEQRTVKRRNSGRTQSGYTKITQKRSEEGLPSFKKTGNIQEKKIGGKKKRNHRA